MTRSIIFQAIFLLLISLTLITVGCSSADKKEAEEKKPIEVGGAPAVRFSEVNQLPAVANRQYKRMTKSQMEEDAELHAQAGSMWVMEGQGAYLFTQNKSRREGDLLNVKIEGAAQSQIETKVTVIKKLLQQLEDEERKAKEAEEAKLAGNSTATTVAPRAPASVSQDKKDKEDEMKIDVVPTRITEKMADGNYRVKGQQPFMIGKREYKVIVTGVVRPEDFNDDGVSSNKVLDPQYDVVSLRKKDI